MKARKGAKRPRVICHMVPSLDGRIVVDRWKLGQALHAEYDRTAATFGADAWMVGRISMAPFAGKGGIPKRKNGERIARTDHVAPHDSTTYAIGLDPSGKLAWRSGAIDGEHVITVLTEKVSDDYLAFLRTRGVSYVFGGKNEIDVAKVLEKLRALFGIETLLLEGGGSINGSFLAAGVIDELSVLLAPVADGSVATPTLFDAGKGVFRRLRLRSVERRPNDLVWLRYEVAR